MYDSILVPTDGSDHARRAAEHAGALAAAVDATVHVLAVADVQAAGGPFSAGGVDEEFVARLEDDHADAVAAIEEVVASHGVGDVRTDVRRGKPTETIVECAEEAGVEAIAMGTHGRTGIDRYVTGSVTEHVVRFAEVPVLTARATGRSEVTGGYDEVLVPTDGSEYAAAAVDHGVGVAEAFGARVHAVNVVDVGNLAASPDAEPDSDVLADFEQTGAAATAAVADRAEEAGLEAVTAVREGSPPAALLDYAEAEGIDLIAMGTAGRTGPSRYLLGSTTERVIRHAEMPVLAVNARDRG